VTEIEGVGDCVLEIEAEIDIDIVEVGVSEIDGVSDELGDSEGVVDAVMDVDGDSDIEGVSDGEKDTLAVSDIVDVGEGVMQLETSTVFVFVSSPQFHGCTVYWIRLVLAINATGWFQVSPGKTGDALHTGAPPLVTSRTQSFPGRSGTTPLF